MRGQKPTYNIASSVVIALCLGLFILGCDNKASKVGARPAPPVQQTVNNTAALEAAAQLQDEPVQKGYIYDQRDRRDPFVPLIIPKKNLKDKEVAKTGTLESYDMGEFTLAAIIKKGTENFALLVAPDNRSFTVNVGTVIGFNKGKVEEITGERIVLVEYSKDFRGKLRPRRITLDFRKGE